MKVRELIERLSTFDPNADVALEDDEGYCEPQVYLSPIVHKDGSEGVIVAVSAYMEPEWAIPERPDDA